MAIILDGTTGITAPDITSAAGLDASDINDGAVTAAKLHTTAVTDKLGYTPVNKAGDTVNGDFVVTGRLRKLHNEGGEWAILGSAFSSSASAYLHVKTNLSKYSFKMVGFRASGFHPYNGYGHGFLGCYAYGDNSAGPYGIVTHNAGTGISIASNMYYSSDGYVVLVWYWPTPYNGLLIEYIANGGSYGSITDVQMVAYSKSSSTSGVY